MNPSRTSRPQGQEDQRSAGAQRDHRCDHLVDPHTPNDRWALPQGLKKEPAHPVAGQNGKRGAAVIALVESPQVCSPKFLTCEQRSV